MTDTRKSDILFTLGEKSGGESERVHVFQERCSASVPLNLLTRDRPGCGRLSVHDA
jgi:hypothetical protein